MSTASSISLSDAGSFRYEQPPPGLRPQYQFQDQIAQVQAVAHNFAHRGNVTDRLVGGPFIRTPQAIATSEQSRRQHRSPASSSMAFTRNSSARLTVTTGSSSLPALSTGGTSRTDSSVCTDDAGRVRGYSSAILEADDEGALRQDISHQPRAPWYPCCFYFLRCPYWSYNMDEWETHCRSHLHRNPPPSKVQCPYCDDLGSQRFANGEEAWEARMHHIANHHIQEGARVEHARPDFGLFYYLWQVRVISNAQLHELRENHILLSSPTHHTVTQGSIADERRRSNQQRERPPGERRMRAGR
ncbi:hypothetical protein EV356DRAFT_210585 [Viridothelium virens]|uniref:Uncharacterized protein n=1 Tax=Viridothelium virens TaxID=1048519 RepID=A0A6A6H525_VIRVR|nr:hypothetical protein EV356DRAFT_210585 [Viridothelium virens]